MADNFYLAMIKTILNQLDLSIYVEDKTLVIESGNNNA